MYTYELRKDYYTALPIYDIYTNNDVYKNMNENDLIRINEVQELVTKIMINNKISLDNFQKEYFLENEELELNNLTATNDFRNYQDKEVYQLLESSSKITFIGDSITEGTKNNYHAWYEPLINNFNNKEVINISKGGYTTKLILRNFKDEILNSKSDLYVIAIGTNDVRYRDAKICAMESLEYINNLSQIVELIKESNIDAKIIFISPWMTLEDDNISKINHEKKEAMINSYSASLENYCKENNFSYINPNNYLRDFFKNKDYTRYMIDPVHPNNTLGITLYSKSIMESSKE